MALSQLSQLRMAKGARDRVEGMEEGMEGRAIAFTTRPQYQTIYPAIKIVSERFGNLWVRGKRYAIDFVAWPRHFVNGQERRPFASCCSSFHPSSFHLYPWMKVSIRLTAVTLERKMSYLVSFFDRIVLGQLLDSLTLPSFFNSCTRQTLLIRIKRALEGNNNNNNNVEIVTQNIVCERYISQRDDSRIR